MSPESAIAADLVLVRREWRAAQRDLIIREAELVIIAEALWPEPRESSDRPAGALEDITPLQIVAGIRSLHELVGRLYAENETLRAKLVPR